MTRSCRSSLVDITVIIRHRTDMAVLVEYGGREPVWLPLSQIELVPDADGKTHILTLPKWLAKEKEMI